MVNLSELLNLKEKKILRQMSWFSLALVVLVIASLFLWSLRLNALNQQAASAQKELVRVSSERDRAKQELERWVNTQKDLEELKASAWYTGNDGTDDFRDDLLQVFKKSGLAVPPINYQYEEAGARNKRIKKLTASFSLKMSYPAWKKFLYELETWPKWLTVDQVNFQRIDNSTGALDLRLAVSGYLVESAGEGK